jgi:hypothetical protein
MHNQSQTPSAQRGVFRTEILAFMLVFFGGGCLLLAIWLTSTFDRERDNSDHNQSIYGTIQISSPYSYLITQTGFPASKLGENGLVSVAYQDAKDVSLAHFLIDYRGISHTVLAVIDKKCAGIQFHGVYSSDKLNYTGNFPAGTLTEHEAQQCVTIAVENVTQTFYSGYINAGGHNESEN